MHRITVFPPPLSVLRETGLHFCSLRLLNRYFSLRDASPSRFSPSSLRTAAMQRPPRPSPWGAVGSDSLAAAARGELGSLPSAAARLPGCQHSEQRLQPEHARFLLATANKGQVRYRKALSSYKGKLITIIRRTYMNIKFAPFSVMFTREVLVRRFVLSFWFF